MVEADAFARGDAFTRYQNMVYLGRDVSNARGFDMDLVLRWLQFGAFSGGMRSSGSVAVMRCHSSLPSREPGLMAVMPS